MSKDWPQEPRLPCVHCRLPADDHVELKCLLESTRYEPIPPTLTRAWFQQTYNLTRGDVEYARVFFDNGFVFTWESDVGEGAGMWVCCGPYKPEDVEGLLTFQDQNDGIAILKAERGANYDLESPFL